MFIPELYIICSTLWVYTEKTHRYNAIKQCMCNIRNPRVDGSKKMMCCNSRRFGRYSPFKIFSIAVKLNVKFGIPSILIITKCVSVKIYARCYWECCVCCCCWWLLLKFETYTLIWNLSTYTYSCGICFLIHLQFF